MQVLNVLFYGLPLERAADVPRARQRRHASTTSSAWRGTYLQPDRLSVVLVGNASAFVRSCGRRLPNVTSSSHCPDLDLTTADLRRPAHSHGGARGRGRLGRRTDAPAMAATVMMSCGEASGDLYAGALAPANCCELDPDARHGTRRRRLRGAGADLDGDYRGFAVTGLTEAAARAARGRSRMIRARSVDRARRERPDVLVAIDFPDFNFRLASAVRRLRHSRRLLHQPAAVGVAARAASRR